MIDPLLKETDHKMDQAVDHANQEFGTIRTGRANPNLLNRITVDYYGTETQLQQIAGFSVPEARLLVFGTEGATDPVLYRKIVGLTPEEVATGGG